MRQQSGESGDASAASQSGPHDSQCSGSDTRWSCKGRFRRLGCRRFPAHPCVVTSTVLSGTPSSISPRRQCHNSDGRALPQERSTRIGRRNIPDGFGVRRSVRHRRGDWRLERAGTPAGNGRWGYPTDRLPPFAYRQHFLPLMHEAYFFPQFCHEKFSRFSNAMFGSIL